MITGQQYIVLEWSLLTLTLICVLLRQYLRFLSRGRFHWGDLFVAIGWIFFASQTCMDTVLLSLGMFHGRIVPGSEKYGAEVGLATYSTTQTALKIVYVESSIYSSIMYCIKWSMICFYHELFPTSLKKLRMALKITTWFTIASWAVTLVVKLFICQPINSNWDPDNYCDTNMSFISNSTEWVLHCGTDVIIYILPLFLLRRLQLPMRQKIGVGITFSLGFVCIFFAILFQVSRITNDAMVKIWLYSALEQTWAIVVVCCPAFKQLLTRKGFKRAIAGRSGSESNETSMSGSRRDTNGFGSRAKSQYSLNERFSRRLSDVGMSAFVTPTNVQLMPSVLVDRQGKSSEKDIGIGITVSYEMDAQSSAGSVVGEPPNVTATAWSTV